MRNFIVFFTILIALVIGATVGYRVFRYSYVRFPTWVIDARYELVSVDNNFIIVSKPVSFTNSMFFPIKFHLGVLQVSDFDDNLVALITIPNQIVLENESVTDVELKITVPYSLVQQVDKSRNFDMAVFFNGTVQGSVYGFPFTKRVSGTLDISPEEELKENILLPLIATIKEMHR